MTFTGSVSLILSFVSWSLFMRLMLSSWTLQIASTDLTSTRLMERQSLSTILLSVRLRPISLLSDSGLEAGSCTMDILFSWKYSLLTSILVFLLPQSFLLPFSWPFYISLLTTFTELENRRIQSPKKLSSRLGKRFLTFELKAVKLISTSIPFKNNSKTLLNNLNLHLPPFKSNPNKNKTTTKKNKIFQSPTKTKLLILSWQSAIYSKKSKKQSKMKKSLL